MNQHWDYDPEKGWIPPASVAPTPSDAPSTPINLRRERIGVASIALGVAFIPLFTAALQFLLVYLIHRFAPSLADADWYYITLSSLPMYVFAMPLSLLLFKLGKAEPPTRTRMSFPVWLGLLAICFTLMYAGNFIGIIVNAIISVFTGKPAVNELAELTMNTPLWANLLFCGILAPILEEIFYRKLVIDRLRRYGDLAAILISGVLFGLVHGNFSQFFYAALIGILFGYIYLRTGKLRYTVALHMAVNLVGGVYATEMTKLLTPILESTDPLMAMVQSPAALFTVLLYFLFLSACIIGAPVALVFLWKKIRLEKGSVRLSAKNFVRIFLVNPAVWLLCSVILLLFLG